MKRISIRRIIALGAVTLGLPLAGFGLHGLFTARCAADLEQPAPKVTFTSEGRAEIYLEKGSGADIAAAIASLPPAGGRVRLGAGEFLVHEPLVIDRDDVELAGHPTETTVLKLADRADCPLLVVGSLETPVARRVSRVIVRHLTLDGNRETQANECNGGPCDAGGLSFIRNNAITIRGAEDIRVEHVTALRARSGGMVLEKECRRVYVSDFTSFDNHYDGFAAYETEESFFTRMHLHDNAAAGISADIRFNRNIVSHTRLENNGSQGIFMRDSNFNNFSHLVITGNGAQGIFIAQADDQHDTPCTGNVFSDLTVSKSGGAGLRVNDVSCIANVLANSLFTANGEGGVSEASLHLIARQNVDVR